MKEVFKKRRQDFHAACIKYSRYVLNDHFILFFLVFMGFLAFQYRSILENLPANPIFLYVFLVLILIFISLMGGRASYLERPDKYYLLAKEDQVIQELKKGNKSSLAFWAVIHVFLFFLLFPLALALGISASMIGFVLVFSLGIKALYFGIREQKELVQSSLDWDREIAREEARKQRILRFFSLFTHVKGLTNSIKARPYLNKLLGIFPKESPYTWAHLYLRSYLRNGDLFSLTLRLLFLSLLSLLFLDQIYIAWGLVTLFNYLLVFQLLGLWPAFDYQYLTQLYPLDLSYKKKGLKLVIQYVFAIVLVTEVLFSLRFLGNLQILLPFILVNGALSYLYLPYRLRGLVDE